MHYSAEFVFPPGPDAHGSVHEIVQYFEKNKKWTAVFPWCDHWRIGGRFSGDKLLASIGKKALKSFCGELDEMSLTVRMVPGPGGKHELHPDDQISKVDALWRERFPDKGDHCPFYDHFLTASGAKYETCRVSEVPKRLTCHRLIVARPDSSRRTKLRPVGMLVYEAWNGVQHQKTDFDGKVAAGIERIVADRMEGHNIDDWSVVTVDYHH